MKNNPRLPSVSQILSWGKRNRILVTLLLFAASFIFFRAAQIFSQETPADPAAGSSTPPEKKDLRKIVRGESLVIGLNVQAHGPEPCQIGIQVHDFDNGTYQKAIALNNTKGDVGLDIGGNYKVGIHAHNNTIRVSEGTCIEFDDEGKIKIRYQKGRIEFLNGDKCIGRINTSGEDHEL